MPLQINDIAPNFTQDTTEGVIDFYDWAGDSWVVLFSHPKDFTPVCTTELGAVAKLKPEFDRRGVKVIGLSVDPVDNHAKWAADIAETQGTAPNYPMIGDTDLKVSKLYGMLPADVQGTSEGRTPANNATVRNVFIIGPDKLIKLLIVYPMTTGRNFDEILRVIDSMQLTARYKVATPVNWRPGDDVIITPYRQQRGCANPVPGLQDAEALSAHHQATRVSDAKGRLIGAIRSGCRANAHPLRCAALEKGPPNRVGPHAHVGPMLQTFRVIINSLVGKVFFGILVLTFGLLGVGYGFRDLLLGATTNNDAAVVGGVTITLNDLDRQYRRQLQDYQRRIGGAFNPTIQRKQAIVHDTLDQAINDALFAQQARDAGFRISDGMVRRIVETEPAFAGEDKRFDAGRFRMVLEQQGMTEASFIPMIRASMARQLLINPIATSATAPKFLVDDIYRYRNEKRVAQTVTIPNTAATGIAAPTDADIDAYYKTHAADFTAPGISDLHRPIADARTCSPPRSSRRTTSCTPRTTSTRPTISRRRSARSPS